jgi:hypothetical protein
MARILHQTLIGLTVLSLAMPAWTAHVCGCAQRAELALRAAKAESPVAAPLRPCCAKRLAAEKTKASPQPGLKAKCCCDDVRWSQSIAKISVPRPVGPLFDLNTAVCEPVAADVETVFSAAMTDAFRTVRAGPLEPVRIRHCRWQV